jgi:hypothetical protein
VYWRSIPTLDTDGITYYCAERDERPPAQAPYTSGNGICEIYEPVEHEGGDCVPARACPFAAGGLKGTGGSQFIPEAMCGGLGECLLEVNGVRGNPEDSGVCRCVPIILSAPLQWDLH